jgi:hypothetical protein
MGSLSIQFDEWSDFYTTFAHHMVDEHDWEAGDVIYFFEKPWKWNGEIEKWAGDRDDKCPRCHEEDGTDE